MMSSLLIISQIARQLPTRSRQYTTAREPLQEDIACSLLLRQHVSNLDITASMTYF